MYEYHAQVLRVVDGDTVDVRIDLGLSVFVEERIRLYGINAPEMRGDTKAQGEESRIALESMLAGDDVILHTVKDKKGKYGRYLGVFWATIDKARPPVNVNDQMIADGRAVLSNYR